MAYDNDFDAYAGRPKDKEADRQDQVSDALKAQIKKETLALFGIKDEYHNFPEPKQKLKNFLFELANGITTNGLDAIEYHKDEFGRCSKCKEWSLISEPCCNARVLENGE